MNKMWGILKVKEIKEKKSEEKTWWNFIWKNRYETLMFQITSLRITRNYYEKLMFIKLIHAISNTFPGFLVIYLSSIVVNIHAYIHCIYYHALLHHAYITFMHLILNPYIQSFFSIFKKYSLYHLQYFI